MSRPALLVLGALACVFAAGCSDSLREPKQPVFVANDDTVEAPPADPAVPDEASSMVGISLMQGPHHVAQ